MSVFYVPGIFYFICISYMQNPINCQATKFIVFIILKRRKLRHMEIK